MTVEEYWTIGPGQTPLAPVCTCPQIDVTTFGKAPGTDTVTGYSAGCPTCPDPYAKADPVVLYDANGPWRSDRPLPPVVDVSWLTFDRIGSDWAWPWWLAVPAAALKRWLIRLWLP